VERYVTLGIVKPLGWLGVAFFSACAVLAVRADQPWPAVGFIPFIALGAYLIYGGYDRHTVDATALVTDSPLRQRYRLLWSEVERVEVGTGGTLVFHGHGKRFVLPPPSMWSGPDKPAIFRVLVHELEARKLVPVPSSTADYKTNKHVRFDHVA
jgi:hypothetical protein